MNTQQRLLRLPAVLATTGMARSTLYKAIQDGQFPPQISIGARAVGWLEADIQAWVGGRVAISRTAAHLQNPANGPRPPARKHDRDNASSTDSSHQ